MWQVTTYRREVTHVQAVQNPELRARGFATLWVRIEVRVLVPGTFHATEE